MNMPRKEKSKICKHCAYSEPTKCGSKVIYYCNKHYSRRTHNGKLKIKARDVACYCYKEYLGDKYIVNSWNVKHFIEYQKVRAQQEKSLTLQHIPKTKDR